MKTNILHTLLMLGVFLFAVSCTKEYEEKQEDTSKSSIAFSFSTPSSMLKSTSCDMEETVSAIITVETAAGGETEFTLSPVTIYKLDGRVFTQKIALHPGEYKLTEFYLVDANNNILFTVPLHESKLADQVINPLPMNFTVDKDVSHDYPVEVVCTDGFEPEDFGLAWFGISEADVCHFEISVSELGSNTLLAADVQVSNNEQYSYEQSIPDDVVPNVVYFQCGHEQYTISVYVPGYEPWQQTYSPTELAEFKDKPIVVELLPMTCGESKIASLVVENTTIGEVHMIPADSGINIRYEMTAEDWYLSSTNLSITSSPNEIPVDAAGDPDLSNFSLAQTHDVPLKSYTYTGINPSADIATIMAHANVTNYKSNLDLIEDALPDDKVNIRVRFTKDPSYFETTITDGGNIDGTYPGNCVDLDNGIMSGRDYDMTLVSSYTGDPQLLALLVDKPENLDLVNYLINQDYSEIGAGGSEVQAAVWTLVDDIKPTSGTGGITWSQQIVDFIVQDAKQYGEGFTPHCGQKALILVDPGVKQDPALMSQVTLVQITTVAIDNVCQPVVVNEEVWAEGIPFKQTGAMYNDYCWK